ncbi:uncharacterized protein LOC116291495, partial [Actinia tenebrosa]|uniref:Uncharacterized protein LOC116291495 n=1 Tax=Actinia tenebrosa TaxID=6105 RepID=A0A6P8HFH2_ACTTE
MLNILTKARPSQNVRDMYRYRCGYGPCVVFQKDALFQDESYESHYPAFQQLMGDLEVQRNGNFELQQERIQSSEYLLLPGDIAAINPGSNNGIPSADKWWLLQVNKAHPADRTASGYHVFGFWLNEEPATNDNSVEGRNFHLLTPSVKVYYGSIIKDIENKLPVVVPVEQLNAGWNNNSVSYVFTDEYCSKLDLISDKFRQDLELPESSNESADEETDEENEETNELYHE